MRAYEFITESVTDGLNIAGYALPNTYIIPELKNNDFYELYRFGLAIADVRGTSIDDTVQNQYRHTFKAESDWGEHQVITSFDPDVGNIIDQALTKVNKRGKKLVSSASSEEVPSTSKLSPVNPFKGYKR
jgi:N-acyl-D-aspartate/D-glutamate deacylase